MKNKIYNINTFNFYRRQVKPEDLDRAFIKLIEEGEEKLKAEKETSIEKDKSNIYNKNINKETNDSSNILNNTENNPRHSKNLRLDLIFPKMSIERIMKIRDLFLEFDADKNRTFDQDEILIMFNMNKIPITLEEVIDLFGFSKKKKFLSFFEFIQLTINEEFSNKFKKLIMEKIRYRTSKTDICPNDFSDMLSHLCEFAKLSPELKDKTREGQKDYITKMSQSIVELSLRDGIRKASTKRKSIMGDIVKSLNEKSVNAKHINFTNENDINKLREKLNIIKKEKEFKNFMEISNKKFLRFKEFLAKTNIRDKILQKKQKLSKSLKTLSNLNSDLGNNYICYFPTENNLRNITTNKLVSYSVKKNKSKLPPIRYNSTERQLTEKKKVKRNLYFNNKINKNNFIKLLKKNIKSKSKKQRIEEEKLKEKEREKEKEYASIIESFTLNSLNLPLIDQFSNTKFKYFNNKERYSENTFVTTGLYSNLNKLQKQL